MYNDPRSHGLWEKTAPQPPATAALKGSVAADVVIVGGGFTGQSAALHLAERDINVVLLEAREIGFGGAGRNVGLINGGMWVMPKELPGVLGETYGERLLGLLGNAPLLVRDLVEKHAIPCEIEKTERCIAQLVKKGSVKSANAANNGPKGARLFVFSMQRKRPDARARQPIPAHFWIRAQAQFSRSPMFAVSPPPRRRRAHGCIRIAPW